VKIVHVDAAGLRPWVEGLRALEREISYPIADGADRFRIDHGADYHPFFSAMGEAHFLVAFEGDRVIGTMAGVKKEGEILGARHVTAYVADLKIAASHRGRGLVTKMLFFALKEALTPKNRHYRTWRYVYGAAMRGQKGDVLRSAKGLSLMRLTHPAAELAVYFVPPERLAAIDPSGAPPPPGPDGLDLSPDAISRSDEAGTVTTRGAKDLRLDSTAKPWPLFHLPLGPRHWLPSHGAYLRGAARAMALRGDPGPACFAIDLRLADHVAWLESQGVTPGARCTIHALGRRPIPRRIPWIHLATSEI
jgi:hypothetical protein